MVALGFEMWESSESKRCIPMICIIITSSITALSRFLGMDIGLETSCEFFYRRYIVLPTKSSKMSLENIR